MDQALRDKMCARMQEVQTQVAERDELIEVIAIALLTRKNVFVLGDTGQAKSAVINLFRDGLTGAIPTRAKPSTSRPFPSFQPPTKYQISPIPRRRYSSRSMTGLN